MQVNNALVEPALYTVNDVKRLLSCSHTTAYRLINAGALDTRKIGSRTLNTAESVKRVIERGAKLDEQKAA